MAQEIVDGERERWISNPLTIHRAISQLRTSTGARCSRFAWTKRTKRRTTYNSGSSMPTNKIFFPCPPDLHMCCLDWKRTLMQILMLTLNNNLWKTRRNLSSRSQSSTRAPIEEINVSEIFTVKIHFVYFMPGWEAISNTRSSPTKIIVKQEC